METTDIDMLRKIIGLISILITVTVFAALVGIYKNSYEIIPFNNDGVFIIEDWEILQNGVRKEIKLPNDIAVRQWESVTIQSVLPNDIPIDSVVFFKSHESAVTVMIDEQVIYSTEYGGEYIGRVWNFIKLPNSCEGKVISIIQKQVMKETPNYHLALLEVGIGNESAIFDYINKNYLFFFYASTVLELISLATLIFAIYATRKNAYAKKLLYISAMFVIISVWSICESPVMQLYFSGMYFNKPYFLIYLSLIFGLLFTVPMMLYCGECYGKRKLFEWLSLITVSTAVILCVIDLFSISSLFKNFSVILFCRAVNIIVFLIFTVLNIKHGNNKLLIISDISICITGIYECVRFLFLGKESVSVLIYAGMAFFIFARIIEAFVSYFKANENYKLEQIRNNEILRSVEVQQNHYKNLSGQLDVTRRMLHDFRQFRTMLYGALQNDTPKKTQELFRQVDDLYKDMNVQVYCDNLEIDSLISYTIENCKKYNILFSHKIELSDTIEIISIYDLCVVIGNLLDNAVEAASKCDLNRKVKITAAVYESNLIIRVENTYSGNLITNGNSFISTKNKPQQHGYGISIVKKTMENGNGELLIKTYDNIFTATAIWKI